MAADAVEGLAIVEGARHMVAAEPRLVAEHGHKRVVEEEGFETEVVVAGHTEVAAGYDLVEHSLDGNSVVAIVLGHD